MKNNARIIAFYLPQYYPTATNNLYYGNGFTEWTNVGKARPLFKGHYQPKVPADLGYYDLRYPEIRELQAQLAREAGIEGFCYYHYWFGEGRQELELPLGEILRLNKPDLPFCLCWANQSWYAKFWNKDASESKMIVEQRYDNEDWRAKHFYSLLPAFRDSRYIKVQDRLLFMIYRPLEYPEVVAFMSQWRMLAAKNNLNDFYFVGQAVNDIEAEKILALGFDGVNIVRKDDFLKKGIYSSTFPVRMWHKFQRFLDKAPYHYDYGKIYESFINENGIECSHNVFPTIIPNWDHSPRSGKSALIFYNSTPENFEKHLRSVFNVVRNKDFDENLLFIKSWNEWGEGNYMEPDLKYGKGYLNVLRNVLYEDGKEQKMTYRP